MSILRVSFILVETLPPETDICGIRRGVHFQVESSKPKEEERKTKEHITSRNGDRHEKNEQQLDRTGQEGPEQSGLENAGRRPMLHWE
ncbi:unnamed protein product [Schistosoma curassoni]|uniref:Uncharacterized protein n=1 Tax=Schistosoma curassoni TaxID=6186 RepID=A0A183KCN2_9TREM|nr:unnamed protein product [Schistosoma curassoni]